MKTKRKEIDLNLLKELFDYKDGHLYWKKNNKQAGTPRKEGYIVIELNKTKYYAHRLIWSLLNGEIPNNKHIDHINRDKADNKIENLRLATSRENALNTNRKSNNTGVYGVTKDRCYYKVSFTVNNKSVHVGNFKDLDKAKECAEQYLLAR
jgi:hypothetical protein